MWLQFAIGALLVSVTTLVHALGTVVALLALRRMHLIAHMSEKAIMVRARALVLLVLSMFALSLLEASIWAEAYLAVGAITVRESAYYFSMVTFTTLGFGDVVLGPEWRILSTFEAANGIIMFGWTTALVFAYVQQLRPRGAS